MAEETKPAFDPFDPHHWEILADVVRARREKWLVDREAKRRPDDPFYCFMLEAEEWIAREGPFAPVIPNLPDWAVANVREAWVQLAKRIATQAALRNVELTIAGVTLTDEQARADRLVEQFIADVLACVRNAEANEPF